METNDGFLKLFRCISKWEWKTRPEMIALWVEILVQTNYADRKYCGETYEKGSFPTSLEKLALGTGLSVQTVRTCLNRLKQTGEITVKSTHHGTKIIVNKWAQYQDVDAEINKRLTNDQQTTNNTKRNKEVKKKEKYKKESEVLEVYDSSNNPPLTPERREELRRRRS